MLNPPPRPFLPISHPPRWHQQQSPDRGIAMTVCIAAIARDGSVVAVSDQMVSMGGGSYCVDSTLIKVEQFHSCWRLMYADDIGVVSSVARRMADLCAGLGSAAPSVVQITSITIEACEAEKKTRGSDRLHSELLLVGFDAASKPHILATVDAPGAVTAVEDYTQLGYFAIGSGAHAALTSLAMRRHTRQKTLPATIYAACEAKFLPESLKTWGVGSSTCILVYRPDGTFRSLNNDAAKKVLRQAWERYGRPRRADECFAEIQREIDSAESRKMDEDGTPDATPSPSF